MQSPLVYEVPKWTDICVRDFKEGSTRLCEVVEVGETKIVIAQLRQIAVYKSQKVIK